MAPARATSPVITRSKQESCDQALLLRRIPFRESSLVLHLLTRDHGRITLMAKGARRASNRLRPHLTQLTPLAVRWVGGARGMGTLTDINRGRELLPPSHHLEGLQLLALAAKLFRDGDPHGFHESRGALQLLARYPQPDAGLVAASWLLLRQAGVISTPDHCWQCGDDTLPRHWVSGQLLCRRCNLGSRGEAMDPALTQLFTGSPSRWDGATIHRGEAIIAQLHQQIHQQGATP